MTKRFIFGLILLVVMAAGLPARSAQAAAEEWWIAYTGLEGNIYLVHPDGSAKIQVTFDARTHPNAQNEPSGMVNYEFIRWSPDGRTLGLIRTEGHVRDNQLVQTSVVHLYNPQLRSLRALGEGPTSFAWKPDSSAIVFYPQINWNPINPPPPTGLMQMSVANGETSDLVKPQNIYPLVSPEYSPDGSYLTFREVKYMEGLGPFAYIDTHDNSWHAWDNKGDLEVGAYSWTPDGSALVFDKNMYIVQPGERIWKSDPQLKNVTPLTPEDQTASFYSPRLSPTGDRILYFSGQGPDTPVSIWLMGLDGSNPRKIYGPVDNIYFMSWSPDGKRAVFSDGQYGSSAVRVLDVNSGEAVEVAKGFRVEWQPRQLGAGAVNSAPTQAAVDPTQGSSAASQPTASAVQPTEALVQAVPLTEQPPVTITAAPAGSSVPLRASNLTILLGGLCLGGLSLLVVIGAIVFGRRKR